MQQNLRGRPSEGYVYKSRMMISRQTRGAAVQVLTGLTLSAARTLLFKHLGIEFSRTAMSSLSYLAVVVSANDKEVLALVSELVVQRASARSDAPTKHVFDERVGDLERWLLLDGWIPESGALVRVTPSAEDVTGIRDMLTENIAASGLDSDRAIIQALEDASASFTAAEPDFNASTTLVRIALETAARRAAEQMAITRKRIYGKDAWGAALEPLRDTNVLNVDEEAMLARVYSFISSGAHVPKGISDEEWARLARTFGLSSLYFLLRRYSAVR